MKKRVVVVITCLGFLWASPIASASTLTANEGCFINKAEPGTVYNSTTLQLRDCSGKPAYSNLVTRSLIHFDLSLLPAEVIVKSATLVLTIAEDGNTNHVYETVGAYRLTSGWDEAEATWNSSPGFDAVPVATIARRAAGVGTPVAGEEVDVNITDLVQSWCDGTATNNGVMLAMTAGNEWGRYVIHSDETSESVCPKLIVEYSERRAIPILQDAFVFKGAPGETYGDNSALNLRDASGYTGYSNLVRDILLQFDLSDLPFSAVIEDAELSLIVKTAAQDQAGLKVFRCESSWDESSICWSNRPTVSGEVYASLASRSAPSAYVEDIYDVTGLVQEWQTGDHPNDGLLIQYETNTFWGSLGYYSKESEYSPLLVVTFATNTFNVEEYGASGNDEMDDTEAILAAISAADASASRAEVFLPAGTYRVSSTNSYALHLFNLSDVCLKGEGTNTVLLVSNPENGGVGIESSTNVMVADFAVDYDPLPLTQGTITAVDTTNGTFDLQIDAGYSELDEPYFSSASAKWGLPVDLNLNIYGPHAYFSSFWTNLGARCWRMTADDPEYLQAYPLSIGDRYAHLARRGDAHAVCFQYCEKVFLNNVSIFSSAGLSSGWQNNGGVVIQGLHVRKRPGSNRLLASNGDGIHAPGSSSAMRIEGCTFEGMPDDGINIHSRSGFIIKNTSDTVKRIGISRTETVFADGDAIHILRQVGGVYTNAVIVTAARVNDSVWEVTLDRPLPNLITGWDGGDKVSNLSRCGQGSVIVNNVFGPHRGRSLLLRSYDVSVVSNTFNNPGACGVALHEEAYSAEGPAPYNIDICENLFIGNGGGRGCIDSRLYDGTGEEASTYNSFNIRIAQNIFTDILGPAVKLRSVSGVVMSDNTVVVQGDIKTEDSPTVLFEHADDIQIDGLAVYDLNPETYAAVHLLPTVGAVNITNLITDLATGSVDIKDER